MHAKRTKARERALQALYQIDVSATDLEEALARFWRNFEPVEIEVRELTEGMVRGVAEHRREIDEAIEGVSTNWRLDRMAKVDRNILRLAVFELRWRTDVPVKVCIDEAIELGKKFGSESSGAFVNGVLDRIAAELPPDRRGEGAGR
ncbi:MAG TPA: transcription antitermination factor NusB [Anaeromyxobacteraceae bacterium]|nr:transcription antitermination factor NusB [Anaeromyxobacteraceae bacterium]